MRATCVVCLKASIVDSTNICSDCVSSLRRTRTKKRNGTNNDQKVHSVPFKTSPVTPRQKSALARQHHQRRNIQNPSLASGETLISTARVDAVNPRSSRRNLRTRSISALPVGLTSEQTRFFVLDVETTGFGPDKERIIEVSIAHYAPVDRTIETFSTLVNPVGVRINFWTYKAHKIRDFDVVNKPRFSAVWTEILSYVGRNNPNVVILSHNAKFDASFCVAELLRANLPIPNWRFACTLPLARRLMPKQKVKLEMLAKRFNIPLKAHRAAEDVQALRLIIDNMAEMAGIQGFSALKCLIANSRPMSSWVKPTYIKSQINSAPLPLLKTSQVTQNSQSSQSSQQE